MFTETIVFRILNFLLGDDVEGLTRNSLKISVLGSSLRMQNVGIRGDALHGFNLPVRVDSVRVCDFSAKVVSFSPFQLALRPTGIAVEASPQRTFAATQDGSARVMKELEVAAFERKSSPLSLDNLTVDLASTASPTATATPRSSSPSSPPASRATS